MRDEEILAIADEESSAEILADEIESNCSAEGTERSKKGDSQEAKVSLVRKDSRKGEDYLGWKGNSRGADAHQQEYSSVAHCINCVSDKACDLGEEMRKHLIKV